MQYRPRSPFAMILAPLLGLACSHHVRLQAPHTSPGARYQCRGESDCTPATTDVPAELNRSRTQFITLPAQCAGRIHQIVILDADSDNPNVDVTCAPAEAPIEEMSLAPTEGR